MIRFKTRSAAVVLVSLVLSGVSGTAVDAVSVRAKPSKPSITVISAKVRSGKLDVAVTFNLASTHRASPILSTQVKAGTLICTAVRRAKSCKIKNLKSKRYGISARAKNKNGWGPWSASITFNATDGRVWRKNPTIPGSVSTTVPGGVSTTGLKFNLKNAVGLTLKSPVSSASVRKLSTGSNLQAVDTAGNTTDAVTSGSASISRFLIAPNDKLYVVFSSKTKVGESSCLLAEVSKETGDPVCIDSTLDSIQWPSEGNGWPNSRAIQFDRSGAIYYVGASGSTTVFRKYSAGVSTDLINDNVLIYNFLARDDGSIFVSGMTKTSNSNWLRRISSSGSLSSLSSGSRANSLYEMPDNYIWIGLWDNEFGIRRFNLANESMVNGYLYSGQKTPSVFTYPLEVCAGDGQGINYAFCGWDGTYVQKLYRTPGGNVFAIAGSGSNGILMQYYPTFSRPSTAVQQVSVSQQVLGYIILSGTNTSGQNITTLYNTATDSEQTLIPSSGEIEVYRLNYVASSNKIMFDGLRFSDNKYVIGQIDLNTGQVSASQTGTSKLIDFQTFSS